VRPFDLIVSTSSLSLSISDRKSTLLISIKEQLSASGYDVYTVPEIPSIVISNGAPYPGISAERNRLLTYEKAMINLQIQMEETFRVIAQSTGRPSVLICDRGALDVAAYLTNELWTETLLYCQTTIEALQARYDLVIHLVTAADGAEKFYTLSNNTARTETIEEARDLDQRTCQAWITHPAHHIVRNEEDGFQAKMLRAVLLIENSLKEYSKH
jgi:nicotinamide riboside kinase